MQIEIENVEKKKYLKLLLAQKDGLLFNFLIISDSDGLENETIQNSIIENISIQ